MSMQMIEDSVRASVSVAGQNTLAAFYPSFSLYYYWSKSGKVIMR